MNKRSLSESDICDRFISPALVSAGWDETRWRREYPFTAGRIIVRGELIARGKQKRADYLIFYKPNISIANCFDLNIASRLSELSTNSMECVLASKSLISCILSGLIRSCFPSIPISTAGSKSER